jgi:hypothetical protein
VSVLEPDRVLTGVSSRLWDRRLLTQGSHLKAEFPHCHVTVVLSLADLETAEMVSGGARANTLYVFLFAIEGLVT